MEIGILMGTAEILSKNRDFEGTVKFIFQGAEEGPPPGEEGGAKMMIKEGVLKNPEQYCTWDDVTKCMNNPWHFRCSINW